MKIAQIAFEALDKECERPYGSKGLNSKYLGDLKVKGSEMWKNFK
jgi:deoxycytidine triphosphate deaminase